MDFDEMSTVTKHMEEMELEKSEATGSSNTLISAKFSSLKPNKDTFKI